jgi:hypothetical protein
MAYANKRPICERLTSTEIVNHLSSLITLQWCPHVVLSLIASYIPCHRVCLIADQNIYVMAFDDIASLTASFRPHESSSSPSDDTKRESVEGEGDTSEEEGSSGPTISVKLPRPFWELLTFEMPAGVEFGGPCDGFTGTGIVTLTSTNRSTHVVVYNINNESYHDYRQRELDRHWNGVNVTHNGLQYLIDDHRDFTCYDPFTNQCISLTQPKWGANKQDAYMCVYRNSIYIFHLSLRIQCYHIDDKKWVEMEFPSISHPRLIGSGNTSRATDDDDNTVTRPRVMFARAIWCGILLLTHDFSYEFHLYVPRGTDTIDHPSHAPTVGGGGTITPLRWSLPYQSGEDSGSMLICRDITIVDDIYLIMFIAPASYDTYRVGSIPAYVMDTREAPGHWYQLPPVPAMWPRAFVV